MGVSIGGILGTASLLPSVIVVLATFASARLLLPNASPWRRALLVLLAVVFWEPPNIRTSVCILAFLLFARLADSVASRRSGVVMPGVSAGIIWLVAFFVSADAGLYSGAALLLCIAATGIVQAGTPGVTSRLSLFLISTVALVAIFVLITNAVMFSPLNFTYWKSSLIIAGGYRWFEPPLWR
ncbi:MAG: hypothetical protein WA655_20840, partial [Candidatus Korobacteraceae bacterium]